MTEIFMHIVNMSITASILAVIVLLLRLLLKKAPKWISVLLWGLVAVRLICPFAVESPFSLMPKTDWVEEASVPEDDLYLSSVPDSIPSIDSSSLGKDVTVHYHPTEPEIEIHKSISMPFVLSCIWLSGIAVLLLHALISTIRLRRSVGTAIWVKNNIWESSAVDSPFVLGLFSPRIYVPRGMTEENLAYVIAHEEAHIQRHDHWWKPLGFILLSLHWFNPVMWLAYILLCRDIEMACDERVVKEYNEAQRADYSEALLECSVKRSMISACPLAFGEVGVKQRIKSVLNYKKPAFWIVVIAVIASIVAAVCFLTNPERIIDSTITGLRFPCSDPTSPEICTVEIDGKIKYDEFKGIIIVDGRKIETSFDMTRKTPTISYYDGSRLENYGLFYILNDTFSKFAFELSGSDEYVICGMSLDEFENEMAKKNYYVDYLHSEADQKSAAEKSPLTLDDVIRLSKKGEALTWEDFAEFKSIDTGSGLYIRVYEIDENFELWIGGGAPIGTPMYIYLTLADDIDTRIDIRDGGVEEFIESIKKPLLNVSDLVNDYESDIRTNIASSLFGASWSSGVNKLEKINTETVGLSEGILLYRLEYWASKGINGLEGANPDDLVIGEVYFAMFHDRATETWARLGTITEEEIDERYNTTPMLELYGNKYTAAVSQMHEAYLQKRPVGFTSFITNTDTTPNENDFISSDPSMSMYDLPLHWFIDMAWNEAESIAASENLAIDKNNFSIRHNSDGKTIWIQFFIADKASQGDEFVEITIVRDDSGTFTVQKDASRLSGSSKRIEGIKSPLTAERIAENDRIGSEFHEFIADESEFTVRILFRTDEPITDIQLTTLDYTEDGFNRGAPLYTLEEMTTDKPLVIGVVFYGDLTTYSFSFTDAAGTEHQYMIYESGKDGSVIIQAY